MTNNENRSMTGKGLRLRVTAQEHSALKQEAQDHGYDLSTLLRLRIFGKVKGMRVIRRPSTDVMLLGDIIGRLTALPHYRNNAVTSYRFQGRLKLFIRPSK